LAAPTGKAGSTFGIPKEIDVWERAIGSANVCGRKHTRQTCQARRLGQHQPQPQPHHAVQLASIMIWLQHKDSVI
jgi:hypothetical protein